MQSEHQINRLFLRQDSQLILSVTGNINDVEYRTKISELSEEISQLDGVTSVNSLTHAGPGSIRGALNSPLWKRLIISDDRKSTNLIILLDEKRFAELISQIEVIMKDFEAEDFHLRAAGLPYVVELIKRNLLRDLKIFSLLAFLIFGFLIFQIFHSKSILFGTMISCLNA